LPSWNKQLLGGLSASAFLRRHWQKQPLLVRGAIPGFAGVLDLSRMIELAGRENCESRLILRKGNGWTVEHGPFEVREVFPPCRRGNWNAALLQGLEQFPVPLHERLLSHFDFIPYSRLDDLMISYACAGGGVGAHSAIPTMCSCCKVRARDAGKWAGSATWPWWKEAPLKILRRFAPEGPMPVVRGHMLYLPPEFAQKALRWAIRYTYSIGFRAPTHTAN